MKKIVSVLLFTLLLCVVLLGQGIPTEKVPAAVIKKLEAQFPTHQNDKWFVVSSGIYRDSFTIDSKPAVAKYDMEGKCWERQQEVSISQLPDIVKENFQKAFTGYLFKSAVKIETRNLSNSITYIISLTSPATNKHGYRELLQVGYSADGRSNSIFKSECKE